MRARASSNSQHSFQLPMATKLTSIFVPNEGKGEGMVESERPAPDEEVVIVDAAEPAAGEEAAAANTAAPKVCVPEGRRERGPLCPSPVSPAKFALLTSSPPLNQARAGLKGRMSEAQRSALRAVFDTTCRRAMRE